MTTKHVLLFVGGVAVGYFLFKQMAKRQMATPVKAAVDPKQAECEAKLAEAMQTIRLAPEAADQYKADFMASCLSVPTETISNQ